MDKKVKMEEEGREGAKWVTHYCRDHQILLVGEGDFSFSLSLAKSFASASKIVTTSLDSYDDVTKRYKHAKSNLDDLQELGAYLLHGVDATKMNLHPNLKRLRFDRIIFNFPHAGFHGKEDNEQVIEKHKTLVLGFFKSASYMLCAGGEIHVSHKTTAPFTDWNIEKLATESCLKLIDCVDFNKEDYPFYNNKRGDGHKCDEPFPLGRCCTFKFIYNPNPNARQNHKRKRKEVSKQQAHLPLLVTFQDEIEHAPEYLPSSVHLSCYPQTRLVPRMNEARSSSFGLTNRHIPITGKHSSNVAEIHGRGAPSAGYFARLGMIPGPHRPFHPQEPLQSPWTSKTNVGYSHQDHLRAMDPIPLSLGDRNEGYKVYGGSLNYFLEAHVRTAANRESYSYDGERSDIERFVARMPGRAVNGDMHCGCSTYLQEGFCGTSQRPSYFRERSEFERRSIAGMPGRDFHSEFHRMSWSNI